jgi:hypothetical protein
MPRFRKRPVVVEATQWFKNGDHPEDACQIIHLTDSEGVQSEGKVVRYYRHPDIAGTTPCISSHPCGHTMHEHSWIDTPEGGHNVCPGDWIITGVKGERYPCKPDIFEMTYEPDQMLPRIEFDLKGVPVVVAVPESEFIALTQAMVLYQGGVAVGKLQDRAFELEWLATAYRRLVEAGYELP